MPTCPTTPLSPERSAVILAEAVRRVDASIPDHALNLPAIRQALETELEKRPLTLMELVKLGRRRVLDSIQRAARKGAGNP